MSRFVIANAIVTGADAEPFKGYVVVDGDKIAASGPGEAPQGLGEVIDAQGAMLLPGLVDSHVHFREPGLEYKATIRSESLAAVAGGVTHVFDMPNTKPATTTVALLEEKRRLAAEHGVYTRYTPLLGIVPGSIAE